MAEKHAKFRLRGHSISKKLFTSELFVFFQVFSSVVPTEGCCHSFSNDPGAAPERRYATEACA